MKKLLINRSLDLISEKKSVKAVEPLVFELKNEFNLQDDRFYNILIALTEAVNNAIIHGNKQDITKRVTIKIKADQDEIRITVQDQGKGFNPEKVADPRDPENLLKDNGRGVFLIRELSDSYQFVFTKKGSRLVMHFLIK